MYLLTSDPLELSTLVARIRALCAFPSEAEATRILSGMRWIGLFSSEKAAVRAGNLLDTLCAQLEAKMQYEESERDLVMLQHKFVVEWADGSSVRFPFLSPFPPLRDGRHECTR